MIGHVHMRKSRVVVLACLAFIIVGAFAWLMAPEPVAGGKALSAWLVDMGVYKQEGSREAIASIGVEAVPFILRKLDREDSPLRNKYRGIWPTLPVFMKKHLAQQKPIQFSAAAAARALMSNDGSAV